VVDDQGGWCEGGGGGEEGGGEDAAEHEEVHGENGTPEKDKCGGLSTTVEMTHLWGRDD
jgi:hypothetical protein